MKVLLVNGSPHREGTTHRALSEVACKLRSLGIDSEEFWIGNGDVHGCMACGKCKSTGKCVFTDNVNEFIELAADADGFIFGSPVYYAGISGQLKSFMDRVFSASSGNMRLKPAAAVTVARRAGCTSAFDQINKYFTISGMIVVPSQYWNNVFGSNAGDAEKDGEGLQTMRTLASNMAYILKLKECGSINGILPPDREPAIRTNFIK